MKTALTIYVSFCLILFACDAPIKQSKVKVYTQWDTIYVTAKRIEHVDANFWGSNGDEYILAFSNMETRHCNFSEYYCIQIGDTIARTKLNTEYFWDYEYRCKP
jgi:hypothetical protein